MARCSGLVAIAVAAVALKPEQLGRFGFMTATSGVLGAIGVLGLSPLLTRQVAAAKQSDEARSVALFAVVTCSATLLCVGGAYFLLLAPGIGPLKWGAAGGRTQLVAIAAWAVGSGLNPVLLSISTGYAAFRFASIATIYRALFVTFGTIAGAFEGRSALSCAFGAAAGELATLLALLLSLTRTGRLGGSLVRGLRTGGIFLLRSGASAGAAALVIQLSIWGAQALLVSTHDGYLANAGITLANRVVLVITFLPTALASSALPYLSKEAADMRGRKRLVRRLLSGSMSSALFMALLAAASSPLYLPWLGAGYMRYWPVISIMCGAAVAIVANNLLGTFAVAACLVRRWVISDLILAGVLMAGAWATVSRIGATGVAISYLLAYGVSAIYLMPAVRTVADPSVSDHEISWR